MKCCLHVRWEPQMSTEQVIAQVPWALSENRKWGLDVVDLSAHRSPCSSLSASTHLSFLLTFTLEDDTQSTCDLSLKCCVTHGLSYIATPRKLSSDWQSIHSSPNLSACVILSNAFAPKQSPLWQSLLCLLEFLLGVRRQEKNENSFSWCPWVWQPHSHGSLLRTPLKFKSLRRILQMTCMYFSLTKEICFIDVIAKNHRVRRNVVMLVSWQPVIFS